MTHRGPFQPRPLCDSVILQRTPSEKSSRVSGLSFLRDLGEHKEMVSSHHGVKNSSFPYNCAGIAP